MSGYLDDEKSSASTSSLLLAHLQQQPYSRRIRTNGRRSGNRANDIDQVDEVGEDEEDDQLSITTWDSQEEERQAQEEWEESMKQLNLAIQRSTQSVSAATQAYPNLPHFGIAFTRFQQHGFSMSFFGISWLWSPMTIIPSSAVAALQP